MWGIIQGFWNEIKESAYGTRQSFEIWFFRNSLLPGLVQYRVFAPEGTPYSMRHLGTAYCLAALGQLFFSEALTPDANVIKITVQEATSEHEKILSRELFAEALAVIKSRAGEIRSQVRPIHLPSSAPITPLRNHVSLFDTE